MKRLILLIVAILLFASIQTGCNKIIINTSDNNSSKGLAQNSQKSSGLVEIKEKDNNRRKIAVVLKAMDSEYWLTVKKGAENAAAEEGVDIAVLAPEKESNYEQQFRIIEDMIEMRVDALVISPCDSKGVKPLVEMAKDRNIPVFTVDTNADADIISFAGTDNKAGGKMAGERIIKILNGKGKVAIITGVLVQQTHRDRVTGFKEALATAPDIELVAEYSANSEFLLAMSVAERIIKINEDLDAIFCTNTLMALGAMEAVNAEGKIGKIKIVGFDTQTDGLNAIKEGSIDSTIAQNPYQMGYISVKNAVKFLNGEEVPKIVDTGTDLVTKDNLINYLK